MGHHADDMCLITYKEKINMKLVRGLPLIKHVWRTKLLTCRKVTNLLV